MFFSSDLGDQEYEDGKANVRGLVARKTFWGRDAGTGGWMEKVLAFYGKNG